MEELDYTLSEIYEALQRLYRALEEKNDVNEFNQAVMQLQEHVPNLNVIDSFEEL